jgi:hypothetical protein
VKCRFGLRCNPVKRVDFELDVSRRFKKTCFKGHLETVLPSESTELRRKRRSRERIQELAAFQGAEVGLRMLQIPRVFSRQIRDREPFATG